jgi:hypothetical protein
MGIMAFTPTSIADIVLLEALVVLLLFILFFVPYYRIFALTALLGLVHYMLVRGESSNYLRFFIFGITPIAVFGLLTAGKNLLTAFKIPHPRRSQLAVWAVVITVLSIGGIIMGMIDVPVFREPVRKIRYLCHLSQTFQGMMNEGVALIPKNSQVCFFMGLPREEELELESRTLTQAQEIATLYTRAHLYKLRPAKSYEYVSYFAVAGRTDFHLGFIEKGITSCPGQPVYLLAFNVYEVLRVETKFPNAIMIYHVQRGRAEAAIFELPAQKLSPKEDIIPSDQQ